MTIEVDVAFDRPGFRLACDFTAPSRGITAISGPSGCGKTTLLRLVAGLERGTGRILVDGTVWQDDNHWLPTHKRQLGFVFQEASLFEHLTVSGNLHYGRRRRNGRQGPSFDEVVALLGVAPLLERQPSTLSGGERQRVAVARALLAGPRLLLMDEPLAGLDNASKADILPYLERLHEELAIPVLYVSHTEEELARLADHLLVMEEGAVRAQGSLAQVLDDPASPLARGDNPFTVVEGQVCAGADDDRLTVIDIGAAQLRMPRFEAAPGRSVRLRIHARDVSLCLEPPGRTSILNVLPGRVATVAPLADGHCLVQVAIGGRKVLARISTFSRDALELAPGLDVYAQIKGLALMR